MAMKEDPTPGKIESKLHHEQAKAGGARKSTVVVMIGVPPPATVAHHAPETGEEPLVTFNIVRFRPLQAGVSVLPELSIPAADAPRSAACVP